MGGHADLLLALDRWGNFTSQGSQLCRDSSPYAGQKGASYDPPTPRLHLYTSYSATSGDAHDDADFRLASAVRM